MQLKHTLVKKHKAPPQPVNWAQPQWRYAASGIRCRADWKNAHVFETEVGLIIAYSRAHAEDAARAILEDQPAECFDLDEREELFQIEN